MTLTDAGSTLESKFGSDTFKKTEFRGELTYKLPLDRFKEVAGVLQGIARVRLPDGHHQRRQFRR